MYKFLHFSIFISSLLLLLRSENTLASNTGNKKQFENIRSNQFFPTNQSTLLVSPGIPDVTSLTATATATTVKLNWINPAVSQFNDLIVVASNTAHSQDFTDAANPTFDGGKIVFSNSSLAKTVTTTNLTRNTPYYFKIFAGKGTNWSFGATITLATLPVTYISFTANQKG